RERFGVTRKFGGADLLAVKRVYNGDSAIAKSNINLLSRFIVTNIVGIVVEIQLSGRLKCFCVVNSEKSSFVIRDKETIEVRNVNESLRRAEAANRMDPLALS